MQKPSAAGRVSQLWLFIVLLLFPAGDLHAQFPFASGTWTPTSPLPNATGGYTLTLLSSSGELLLVGGSNGTIISNQAFIYNPLSHSFRQTAHPMNVARTGHTATLLPDETVLITGGITFQGITNSAELYDPLTDGFVTVGPMSTARVSHTATLVDSIHIIDKDGLPNWVPTQLRVLIAGGTGTSSAPLDSLEYYNFYTRKFDSVAEKLKTARYGHTATWLPSEDLILIAGGTTSGAAPSIGTAEVYNPANEKILTTVNMVSPRAFHTATLLKNGSALLAGGVNGGTILDSAEIFDPAHLTTAGTSGKMAFAQANHAAALMTDGSVLLAGGDGLNSTPIANTQIFNPTTHLFFSVPSMITARREFQMGIAINSQEVLAAGGEFFPNGGPPGVLGISASEIFTPRGPRQPKFIDFNFCIFHPAACQILRQHSPLILSGMVHHSMVVAPFPRTLQELPRDRKAPVSYKIVISGLADSWDAAAVSEDGMPLGAAGGKAEQAQIINLNFKDAKSFEDAEESSLLVFQMTEKAATGKDYPITIKTELASRPDLARGAQKP